jgi:hypothetical protein
VKQSVLDRAVARATGESLSVIRKMGFSVICPPAADHRSYRPNRSRKGNRRAAFATAGTGS